MEARKTDICPTENINKSRGIWGGQRGRVPFSVNNRFSLSAKHFLGALHISLGCNDTYDASLTFITMVFPQNVFAHTVQVTNH